MSPDRSGPPGRDPHSPAPAGESVVVALLGEIALRRDGALVPLPGARSRLLLTSLALRPGRTRGAQSLIEDVWGEHPPKAPMNALHTQVSRLRSALPEGALETGPAGYRLCLGVDEVDLGVARQLVRQARERQAQGDPGGCLAALRQVRTLWRGEPGSDLPACELADELRALAADLLDESDALDIAARESAGDVEGALRSARRRAAGEPLDESAQATMMRLLVAAGRGTEALESFAVFRSRLAERLGVDPGPELIAMNTAILRGEPVGLVALGAARDGYPRGDVRRHGDSADVGSGPGVSPNAAGDGISPDGFSDGGVRSDTARRQADPAVGGPPDAASPGPGYPPSALLLGAAQAGHASLPGYAEAPPSSGSSEALGHASPEFAQPIAIGLRAAPNALLGRADDLSALTGLLRRSRVVTVLGPGGAGKTRVVNEIGRHVAAARAVALVELASVRAESGDARAEIEAAIAGVLGLGEVTFDSAAALRARQTVDARQRLREAVSARSMLLILDNCEHLIEAVALVVADLIGVADRLTVLTTSRAPLMITAETVYPLPPLTVDAAGSPATELFAARARAVRPGVRLDRDVVAELCRTLDGLPLAIELAAARVRVMSVEEINERLADRFALLRHGDRTSPERHRTLYAVIDWSWNLLDRPQQVALCRLCRFPAGFTLAAAETVASGPEVDDVAAALDGLVNQSLLDVLDDAGNGTRYRMLETVREFGEEQLIGMTGAADSVDAAMARWARAFADDSARRYLSGDQVQLALSVGAELDNLLVVLRGALERHDAATVYTVFPVVGALWAMRGSHGEVVGWIARVADVEPPPGPDAPPPDLVLTTHQLMFLHLAFTDGDVRTLARLRTRVRRLLRDAFDLREHNRFVGRVLLLRPSGAGLGRLIAEALRSADDETRAGALLLRANIRENLGDVRGSTADAIRALRIIGHNQVWGRAMVCGHLGQVCGQIAEYAESVIYYRRALELLQRLGAYEDTAQTRCMLVASLIGIGELEQAAHELDLAVGGADIAEVVRGEGGASGFPSRNTVGSPNRLLAMVVQSAAELAYAQGDSEGGLYRYRRALELYGWPDAAFGPGPGGLMLAAAALDGRVLYGAVEAGAVLAAELAELTGPVMTQFQDLPQIGAVACALGSYLIAADRDARRGLELLALAPKVYCRQDFPTMSWARHERHAAAVLGGDRVARERGRVAHLRRRDAAGRILEMLGELAGDLRGGRVESEGQAYEVLRQVDSEHNFRVPGDGDGTRRSR